MIGKLITFEGIEGSGKTTQLKLLGRYLGKRRVKFIATREPGGTSFGREVRRILLDTSGPDRTPIAELLLYLADRCQHLSEKIEPALAEGAHVLCDRYHDATIAYQGYGRGIDLKLIDKLSSMLNIREPDLTILLDLDARVGLMRARRRNSSRGSGRLGGRGGKEGRFEAEDLSFHSRVRRGYLQLAKANPDRIKVVSATDSVRATHAKIRKIIDNFLGLRL